MPRRSKPVVGPAVARSKRPRTPTEVFRRDQSLAALADMRREGMSLTEAARARGIDFALALQYVGPALYRSSNGRYRARVFDRLPREVSILTPEGPIWITVRDSRTASKIGEHRARVKEWRRNRDRAVFTPFDRRSFRAGGVTYRFVTDPETLNQLEGADLLALETLYRSVQAGAST